MLNAFASLKCSKKCERNVQKPSLEVLLHVLPAAVKRGA